MSKTVKVKNYLGIVDEYIANQSITPGMLVRLRSDNRVERHAVATGFAVPMFASEDEFQGRSISDDYVTGETVQVWITGRGDEVNTLLRAGTTAAVGAFLVSAGNGTLEPFVTTGTIVAQALEAVTAGGGVPARIRVRIV